MKNQDNIRAKTIGRDNPKNKMCQCSLEDRRSGYLCAQTDMERFMRSVEGGEILSKFRKRLLRHVIEDVEYVRLDTRIAAHITLENGDVIQLLPPFLEVDRLRFNHPAILEREYYKDYPERNPNPKAPPSRKKSP